MRFFAKLFLIVILLMSSQAFATEATDRRIQGEINRAIHKMFAEGDADVRISVKDARVIATGQVANGAQKYVVDMIVKRTPDVEAFENRINLRSNGR